MSIVFSDKVTAGNVRITDDGYLVADAPVARTGIQIYRGVEVGRPELDQVRVYRSPEEVFAKDSMHSYAHRPMTNDHPSDLVDADNWKDLAIGQTGDEITRDGDTVRVPLVMMDAAAINSFRQGKRELSMGYTADIEFTDGVQETPDGEQYDAVQKNLRMNHLALVGKGRAGNARIGDGGDPSNAANSENEEGLNMADNLRKVVVDGLEVETTDQGAQAIAKLQTQIADATAEHEQAASQAAETIAAKDKELAARDAEIEKLKDSQLSDADVDALVTARGDLVAKAKSLHDADYTGKSEAEIKKAVVAARFGDEAVADKSDAYIDARFDVLLEDGDKGGNGGTGSPVHQALNDNAGQSGAAPDAEKAYEARNKRLEDGYKGDVSAAQ